MIRVYAIVGALFLAALAWQTHRANSAIKANAVLTVERDAARWQVEQERENTRKANESAKRYQVKADALEADRRDNPLPPVRMCPRARPVLPQTAATAVPGEAAQADNPPANAGDRDIGPALDDFATDAELNMIQCEELIRWVQGR